MAASTSGAVSMSRTAVILLNQARSNRERAERTRRLAKQFVTPEVCGKLMRFAAALEQTALDLEARAAALAETVERTHRLPAELRDISITAGATVRNLRAKRSGSERSSG
jgi:hypothetical protein